MGERWTATENEKEIIEKPSPKKREGEYKGERYSVDTHARIHEHTRTDKQTDKKTDPSFTVEVD